MRRHAQPLLLLTLGVAVLRVSLFSDVCLRYVKESAQPFLIATGLLLAALGLAGLARDVVPRARERTQGAPGKGTEKSAATSESIRQDAHGPASHEYAHHHSHDAEAEAEVHGHDHSRGPRVAWLLLPPALLLLLFAPPALGSYTASRDQPQLVQDYEHFDPLPAAGSPVPLSLTELVARLQQDESGSLKGRTLVLQGFVTPARESAGTKAGTWELTRLLVSCCAADSQALRVTVHGAQAPPADAWVRVTARWRPGGTFGTTSAALALDAVSVTRVPEPANPYLDKAPVL
ncbi:TIGR03943 family protein [Streptomyces sp. NBC_00237]|uniref:TIGR03943 family putative permease subunit n=1 Tax=Streptomyces sp. NBC_00237 TaxID=2975687 RepID=UPI0022536883|nr:TIGR03943 family protein [Streptomyces sp. NBC_00237]MCX5206247.1 TIGR03943 family protein [Streptomyces sp. NBC_00237]